MLSAEEGDIIARLLSGYLKNDTETQRRAVALKQALILGERTGIENGIDITLSTGQFSIIFDENSHTVSAAPKASVSLPAFNDTNVELEAHFTRNSGSGYDELTFDNTRFSVSTQIIGTADKERELSLLKSERAVLEARRSVKTRAREAEKEFYTKLQELYDETAQALNYEEEAFDKELELLVAVAQGYSQSSIKYRTLELEVKDLRRGAEESRRIAGRKLTRFARDCGIPKLETVPELTVTVIDIPEKPLPDAGRFSKVEAARWQIFIGEKDRASRQNFDLRAEGDITLNNTQFERGTSAGAALILGWKGIDFSLGSEIPISGNKKYPALKLSLSFNTGKQRLAPLLDKEKILEAETQALTLSEAEREWEDLAEDVTSKREDLIWENKQLKTQLELYTALEKDAQTLYRRGLSAEAEYRKAEANRARAHFRLLASNVKLCIQIIDESLYFVDDD